MINNSIGEEGKPKQKKVKQSKSVLSQMSFHEDRDDLKHTNFQTMMGITNSMVGSVILVVPVSFKNNGILSCTLVMILLGFIQYKTCSLLLVHQKTNEQSTEKIIKRLLGRRWATAFSFASGTLLFIVGIIYYQLINITLYLIVSFVMLKCDYENFDKTNFMTYDKYSKQWQAIILFLPLSLLLLFKDIEKIIKIAHYGVFAIILYCFYIVFIFFQTLFDGKFSENAESITWFTTDISEAAGLFALAFMVHNAIGQLIKNNQKKEDNVKVTAFAYVLASFIYGSIGILGAIGIAGLKPYSAKPDSILDYFEATDIAVLIIDGLILIHLITAFPIFNFISKHQILEAIYPNGQYPPLIYWGFSAFLMIVALTVQLFNIPVGNVIGFDGAVCGFLLIYIIPIFIHYQCYYGKKKEVSEDNLLHPQHAECNSHPEKDRMPMWARFIFYGLFICVGLYNLYIQVVGLFQ
ncbi:hypothetical protein pb186bvf_007177 [Paramecium bursaria]